MQSRRQSQELQFLTYHYINYQQLQGTSLNVQRHSCMPILVPKAVLRCMHRKKSQDGKVRQTTVPGSTGILHTSAKLPDEHLLGHGWTKALACHVRKQKKRRKRFAKELYKCHHECIPEEQAEHLNVIARRSYHSHMHTSCSPSLLLVCLGTSCLEIKLTYSICCAPWFTAHSAATCGPQS